MAELMADSLVAWMVVMMVGPWAELLVDKMVEQMVAWQVVMLAA